MSAVLKDEMGSGILEEEEETNAFFCFVFSPLHSLVLVT